VTTTNAAGQFIFSGLTAGTYHLREILPSGWTETAPSGGSNDVTVVAGQNYAGRDFGSTDVVPAITVTVEQAVGQVDPTNGATIHYTAVFSSAVSNFDSSDVTITGGSGATAVVTGSGTTYDIAVVGHGGYGHGRS